ncbi:MAG: YidC/Oxa1 family membrane protein insertase [Lachnospiraceae bacterium]|nr:YidC/Oxa1 family membrane protein insertase [Candidatus Equihabitans merdae]
MKFVATKSNMFLIKYVALVLGLLMNAIFFVLNRMNIPNVGLSIILFTIIIYALMTPLTVKQQRFSKMNAAMTPELNKIRAKYKGKTDQVSQQKMMDETNAVYAKYGVSPTGSCVQLAVQMPVLFGLYQVIYKIPGYINIIGDKIGKVVAMDGVEKFIADFAGNYNNLIISKDPGTADYIDALYKLNSSQWTEILQQAKGQSFESALVDLHGYVSKVTSFLGFNISDTPFNMFKAGITGAGIGFVIIAILFPVLAWLTQFLSTKVMQSATTGKDNGPMDQMQASMKSLNVTMPLISAVFCFTLPSGIGLYWVFGALVRMIQTMIINRRLDKEDLDAVIEKNKAKAEEKAKKAAAKNGSSYEQIAKNSSINTRNIDTAGQNTRSAQLNARLKALEERELEAPAAGSIASRAGMVAEYNEKHNKTRKHADAKKK